METMEEIHKARVTLQHAQERLRVAEDELSSLHGWWCVQLRKHRPDLGEKQSRLDTEIRELRKVLGV